MPTLNKKALDALIPPGWVEVKIAECPVCQWGVLEWSTTCFTCDEPIDHAKLFPSEFVALCRAAGQTRGGFILADHALEMAEERKIDFRDVREALLTAIQSTPQRDGRWRVISTAGVTLIVAPHPRFVVVTVY